MSTRFRLRPKPKGVVGLVGLAIGGLTVGSLAAVGPTSAAAAAGVAPESCPALASGPSIDTLTSEASPSLDVIAEPRTSLWRQQYAQAVRTDFGLPATPAAIAGAAAEAGSTSTDLGTPLTAAERAKLASDKTAVEQSVAVGNVAAKALPGAFAASWFDYRENAIVVTFTAAGCPDSALVSSLKAATNARVVLAQAAHDASAKRLASLQEALTRDGARLHGDGIVINRTAIQPNIDSVLVTLDPASASDAKARLSALEGSAGLVFTPTGPSLQLADLRLDPPANSSVIGGEDITDGTQRCTANISANDGKGNWYVMSDGHCAQTGTTFSQNSGDSTHEFNYDASKSIGKAGHNPVFSGSSTTCDCVAFGPVPASRDSRQAIVNSENTFTFSYVASQQSRYSGQPQACEDGVSEYDKYRQIICGPVDQTSVSGTATAAGHTYTVRDMFHVKYAGGTNPIAGDSGAPTGSGDTLLGLVEDAAGDSNKTLHISEVCSCASWIVPGH